MACGCTASHSLLAEATYQVTSGETFSVTLDFAGADSAKAQLRTSLSGGALTASFTPVVGTDDVIYSVSTVGVTPGVYYFDCWAEVDGAWTALLSRQALIVVEGVTAIP